MTPADVVRSATAEAAHWNFDTPAGAAPEKCCDGIRWAVSGHVRSLPGCL